MSEIKLKPCPFCGGEAWTFHIPENNEYEMKLHEWIWRTPGRWLVGCDTQLCMLNINNMPETFASEKEAAEAWNKRAELPSAERSGHWIKHGEPPWYVIECSECGAHWQMSGSWDANNFCGNCGAKMDEDDEVSECQK